MQKQLALVVGLGVVLMLSSAVYAQPEYYGPCTVAELFWCDGDQFPCETHADCVGHGGLEQCVPSATGPLPPPCTYLTSQDYHELKAAGVPVAILDIWHFGFTNPSITWGELEDPPLPYDIEEFDSTLRLAITGLEGTVMEGYERVLELDAHCRVKTDVRGSGTVTIANEMLSLVASLSGDTDFATLDITAGAEQGLDASNGTTTLTLQSDGSFVVDSFFDITYHINFTGAGALDGVSGDFDGTADVQAVGTPIPAVSQWGLAVLALLVLAGATVVIRRHTALAR